MKHGLITTSNENYVLLLPIEKENVVNLQVTHNLECFRQPSGLLATQDESRDMGTIVITDYRMYLPIFLIYSYNSDLVYGE